VGPRHAAQFLPLMSLCLLLRRAVAYAAARIRKKRLLSAAAATPVRALICCRLMPCRARFHSGCDRRERYEAGQARHPARSQRLSNFEAAIVFIELSSLPATLLPFAHCRPAATFDAGGVAAQRGERRDGSSVTIFRYIADACPPYEEG